MKVDAYNYKFIPLMMELEFSLRLEIHKFSMNVAGGPQHRKH